MKNLMKKEFNCLLIQSKFSAFSYWNYTEVCELVGAKYPAAPLGLLTVAALLPQQWTFKLVDENIEDVMDDDFEWANIVCIGGMLPQQSSMIFLISRAHLFGLPVVVGGPDPTSQPELYQLADYRVLGEGEVTIPMLIDDLSKGIPSGLYQSDKKADMTHAVVPRFDLIRFEDYLQIGIQYSRGCPFGCEFCNIVELFGRQPRSKSSTQMIKELQTLYNLGYRGHIDIVDDNFIGNKMQVKQTLSAMKNWLASHQYPFYFSTECSINLADDNALLQLMQDVDFRYIFMGIETPEKEALIATNKRANVNRQIDATIQKVNSYGMIVNAGFIIGFDHESQEIGDHMIRCIQDSGISMAMLGMLYALPNTQLSRRLEKEGRLFKDSSVLNTEQEIADQTTDGLNFITARPRLDIIKDYLRIEVFIYHPDHYFQRVLQTALQLKPHSNHKPGFKNQFKKGKSFVKLCRKLGHERSIAWPFFKMLGRVLVKNPTAVEPAVNLSAMFLHFHQQSQYIIERIKKEIETLENNQQKPWGVLLGTINQSEYVSTLEA